MSTPQEIASKYYYYHAAKELPQTREEWDVLYNRLVKWFALPDSDDTKHAVSTLILHMDQQKHKAPLKLFVRAIKKQIANAAAYAVVEELRASKAQKAVATEA